MNIHVDTGRQTTGAVDAYKAGILAYITGNVHCPHEEGTEDYIDWWAGWEDECEAREGDDDDDR